MDNNNFYEALADKILAGTGFKQGDRLFIHNNCVEAGEFINIIHQKACEMGVSLVDIWWDTDEIREHIYSLESPYKTKTMVQRKMMELSDTDVYIKIKSGNPIDFEKFPNAIEYNDKMVPINEYTSNAKHIRRMLVYFPGKGLQTRTGITQDSLLEAFAGAILKTDYTNVYQQNERLINALLAGRDIRILGKETNLSLQLSPEIDIINAHGERNLPDGEVFTAPIRDSINGTILFDIKTHFYGIDFFNIKLQFKNGKVIHATCDGKKELEGLTQLLNSHENNRYVGEFAIGTNPNIQEALGVTITDEKILGTIHLALGRCYAKTDNGNRDASIHWDLIKDMRLEGSEVWADDACILKDGEILV